MKKKVYIRFKPWYNKYIKKKREYNIWITDSDSNRQGDRGTMR